MKKVAFKELQKDIGPTLVYRHKGDFPENDFIVGVNEETVLTCLVDTLWILICI